VNGIFPVTDEGTFRVALVGDLAWFHLEQLRHCANCAARLQRDMKACGQRRQYLLRRPRDEVKRNASFDAAGREPREAVGKFARVLCHPDTASNDTRSVLLAEHN
jgi:hypothetical protein